MKRYNGIISIAKVVCALLVLYIHIPFYQGKYALFLWKIPTMFAVPVFFSISGMLWGRGSKKVSYKVIKTRVFSNLARYTMWLLFTVLYQILIYRMSFISAFHRYFSVFFNANEYLIGMFWYVLVLVYCGIFICIYELVIERILEKNTLMLN